jgi:hypothetical protein
MDVFGGLTMYADCPMVLDLSGAGLALTAITGEPHLCEPLIARAAFQQFQQQRQAGMVA